MSDIPTTSGIYCILNEITGKLYIGSAVNLRERRRQHFRLLREGIHVNTYLQHSVNKYGLSAFSFHIIELCDKQELLPREQIYLDETKCYCAKNGYNVCKFAGSKINTRDSAETRLKKSAARKGNKNSFYGKRHTDETKAKISRANSRENSAHYGKRFSEETRAKMSAALRSRPKLFGKRNPFYGKKHSADSITKMSEARRRHWKQYYYAERDAFQLLLF